MSDERSDPTRWNHANPVLEVSDVERAIAYYRDVLGLSPAWMWGDRIGRVHTDYGAIEVYLSRAARPSPSRLAVFVEDADATYKKHRAAGAQIVGEPKPKPGVCAGPPSVTLTGT
ncbi:MAG: VOC family protein [Solirubrobacteraceae bacterium]